MIQKNLSKDNTAQEVEVKAKGIEIDVLINNAGVGDYGRFIDIPPLSSDERFAS